MSKVPNPTSDSIFNAIREGKDEAEFENPHTLSEEERRMHAIKQVARQNIIAKANEYIKTPLEDRPEKRHLLREIQEIVDTLDDAFVLVVGQKDGVPFSITFNPNTPEPADPLIHPDESQKE